MDRFRRLIAAALLAGSLAGLVLFAVQHVTIIPLIDRAEVFEEAAEHAHAAAGHSHDDEGWQPAAGIQRIGLTAVTTMLSGIGFAAVLLAAMTISGTTINTWRGALWGLAGFVCFVLAPALGMPPKPPGAAVGDLQLRQLWWLGTVVATAAGLWLIFGRSESWWVRLVGVVVLVLPHMVSAPAPEGANVVPPELMRDFALLSVATNLMFWVVLGSLCGLFRDREGRQAPG